MMHLPVTAFVEPMKIGYPGILIGALLLFFGRKLFWFGIAVVGFYIGMSFADAVGFAGEGLGGILVGIAAGVLGVLVLYALQKLALSILGFCAGVYLTFMLMHRLQFDVTWAWLLGGGLAGLIVASVFFHTAVIILTAVFGAFCIVRELPGGTESQSVVFLLLVLAGVYVQNSMRKGHGKGERKGAGSSESEG
ncbi:MAG TPA: hypothetical protein VMW43_11760 [Bacteroidota bacterium]|nr:hypothetical protein [Bacteroidota bacterium]